MTNIQFILRRAATAVALVAFAGPSTAWAESLALVFSNARYTDIDAARDTAGWSDLADAFEEAGFRVFGEPDISAAAMRRTATEFREAMGAGNVERIAIVLSGHFVQGPRDSWLLGRDASGISSLTVGAEGLSVSALTDLAGTYPSRTLVVLVPAGNRNLPTGPGLSPGVATRDIPQGVTVAQGTARGMQRWLDGAILTPGLSLSAAAEAAPDGVRIDGFLSDRIGFVETEQAQEPEEIASPGAPSALTEASFWNSVRDIDTDAAYERYLQRYPRGTYAADAQARIADIRNAPQQQAEAREAALELSRDARRDVQRDLSLLGFDPRGIDGVFGPGSRAAIVAHQRSLDLPETGFLTTEQLRILRRDAAARAQELEREAQERREREEREDRAYWESVGRGQDEAGLRAYLERYPDGLFADLAEQRLAQIDDDRRQQAVAAERDRWDRAREQDSAQAYREFLDAYPDGTFAETARGRLAQAQSDDTNRDEVEAARAEESRVAGNQVVRLLVEQRLNQIGVEPGAVDGSFDDETRRAIRRFQQAADLPVTGYVTQATMVRLLASGALGRN